MRKPSSSRVPQAAAYEGNASSPGGRSRRDFLKASAAGVAAAAGIPRTLASAEGAAAEDSQAVLVVEKQGSFAFGGTVATNAVGQTLHGDHGYAQFQIPPNPRRYPLVMWHGGSTFSKTWESTFDGRDGYQTIFVRRGFPVYIIDRPRKGRAGKGTVGTTISPTFGGEQDTFAIWRLGVWTPPEPPRFFPNAQVPPNDPEFLNQLYRSQSPDTGPGSTNLSVGAVVALLERTGPAVLVTHSAGGLPGWVTRIRSANVAGIVAYEPAGFVFPSDALPPPVPTSDARVAATTAPVAVSPAEFQKLTNIPIQIVYGDNMELTTPSPIFGVELWRVVWQRVHQFADAVNSRGGDVQILHLPTLGIFGNTHNPFSDLNNIQVAKLMSKYLHEKGLDKRRRDGQRD